MVKNLKHDVTNIMEKFCDAGMFSSSGAGISLCYVLNLRQAEQNDIKLNKSQLIDTAPVRLGSLTSKRAALEKLISRGALRSEVGIKKSERHIFLTEFARKLLLLGNN